jgi:hypothetical protein
MRYELYWNEDTVAASQVLGTYDNLDDLRNAQLKYENLGMITYVVTTEVKPDE